MNRVFISYAREDAGRARALWNALQSNHVEAWWDEKIQIGEVFTQEIRKRIDEADAVLVLWSRASVASTWVRREAERAAQNGTLRPVLLDNIQPPPEFAELDCAVLTDWRPGVPHPEFEQLVQALSPNPGKGAAWTVQALSKTKLLVKLNSDSHTIEYKAPYLLVDGRQDPARANQLDALRVFHFALGDGPQRYAARLEVQVTMFRGDVKWVRLTVADRPLYQG